MEKRNEIEYGDGFFANLRRLPRETVEKFSFPLELLRVDAFDPRFHTKPLGPPLKDKYSFRITRDWRVGFMFKGPHRIKLLIADHRDKIYERMRRLL